MSDESGQDDKILAVAHYDEAYSTSTTSETCPSIPMRHELKRFFLDYKVLEKRKVDVGEFMDKHKAYDCIKTGMKMYAEKFGE